MQLNRRMIIGKREAPSSSSDSQKMKNALHRHSLHGGLQEIVQPVPMAIKLNGWPSHTNLLVQDGVSALSSLDFFFLSAPCSGLKSEAGATQLTWALFFFFSLYSPGQQCLISRLLSSPPLLRRRPGAAQAAAAAGAPTLTWFKIGAKSRSHFFC